MKAYTDIKQSKKLAEILPTDSADAYYTVIDQGLFLEIKQDIEPSKDDIPCWSLAALLEILPSHLGEFKDGVDFGLSKSVNGKWYSAHYLKTSDNGELSAVYVKTGDTSIDACYEMILELHKNKLI